MDTSFDVRIWNIEVRKLAKGRQSYRVAWLVGGGEPFREKFSTLGLAESFRSDLLSAARKGEAFRLSDGLPVSMARTTSVCTWLQFAQSYVDFKWPDTAPGHRRNMTEALTTATTAMLSTERGKPTDKALRAATFRAINPKTRDGQHSEEISSAIRWLERSARPVGDIAESKVLLAVIAAMGRKLDGGKTASSTTRRKRMTLTNALDYAVACGLLTTNPLPSVKASTANKAKPVRQVDRRSVANPIQARTLLNAVRDVGEHGNRLLAFFGCMYYSGLRPEEVAWLGKSNLALPESGWGELHLEHAVPEIAEEWTDSGSRTEERGLKHRDPNEGRTVPCPPELTDLLHWHMEQFGTAPDGRLFWGSRTGGRVGSSSYGRVWAAAREAAFTPEVVASPLAKRPYDLRHACVSTWLAGGVAPPRVARWAGHSPAVLMQVYAKVLDGGDQAARDQIDAALGRR